MKEFAKLCKKLNYKFKDLSLLDAALTHRSVKGSNNERLEFLGDAAVNFIIAEVLYTKHPHAREGELSRLRASFVKGETLAALAREINLAEYLRLGAGELKSGGAYRESIQADAMEAIIGAIYLDGGFDACRATVIQWYQHRLESKTGLKNLKDPKTQLQEYLQANKYPLPKYTITKIGGEAHKQIFYMECSVEGLETITQGTGNSRRKAEQDAAKKFLEDVIENG